VKSVVSKHRDITGEHNMGYQIERRSGTVAPTATSTPLVRYFNTGMTCLVAVGLICEGFWLSRDPGFAVGGAFAGATLAMGALGLVLGGSLAFALLRERR
jgi:hypothetical protein